MLSRIESGLFTPVSSSEGTKRETFYQCRLCHGGQDSCAAFVQSSLFLKDENLRREPQAFPLSAWPYGDGTSRQETVEPPRGAP